MMVLSLTQSHDLNDSFIRKEIETEITRLFQFGTLSENVIITNVHVPQKFTKIIPIFRMQLIKAVITQVSNISN